MYREIQILPKFQVRYEIIGRGKATKYFQIDADTGALKITNDLKKEIDTEYQVSCKKIICLKKKLTNNLGGRTSI